ncbi:MAG TPA: hypothetical protein VK897_17495 [Anaerolineales bacterium]|nr:hypothetical protein [Anaerolineales bacterium]
MHQSFHSYPSKLWDAFFRPLKEKEYSTFRLAFLGFLYVFGVYLWGKMFSWGRMPLDFFDWALINIPRIDFVRDALQMGVLPLHMADIAPLHHISDRFLTLPDVITTPQMILLLFLPIERFVFFDIILHYSISFLGLLWFYRRYQLSLYTFTILFFLFEFNGYIFTHYSVGHFTWAAYFLFPVFFSLVIRFLEGESGWKWLASISFLLFYMVLAGSQHHYVWLLLFLGVLILTCWRRSKWIFLTILVSGLLSAVRLLPPALQLADYQKKAIFNAVYGYPSFAHLIDSMIFIQLPVESPVNYYQLNVFSENFWDFNFYIGVIGFAFILYFGLFMWLREPLPRYRELIVPVFVLTALSIGSTYWIVRITGIPLFASERAIMRMISVPMVWLFLIGSISFQTWWNGKGFGTSHQLVALAGLGFLFIDLWSNMKVWRPSEIKQYFLPVDMDITGSSVANHADPSYLLVLAIGLGITLLIAIFLTAMSGREIRWKNSQP